MGKVQGSYDSVIRGVSEQVPQDRRPGQHFVQDNFISDPVKGLARRHGSVMQDEKRLRSFDQAIWDAVVADTANHKEFTFYVDGVEYAMLYRSKAAPSPAVADLSFAFAFNKDTRRFVPIQYAPSDPALTELKSGGVSAAVNVGKYIYLAGNTIVPTWVPTERFDNALNLSRMVVWVRGGAFSRTFSVTLNKPDGTKVTAEYKTKPSAYPELLDTSDLLTSDPDYQKKVNDRVYAYNSAVTAYIGEAAEDITPENIAAKLRDALATAGVTGLGLEGSTVTISNSDYSEVGADDGGDGSLIRAVGNRVSAPELVSTVHYVGKIVKVRPKKTAEDDALYLEAIPKDAGATGWGEVTWREAAGTVFTPSSVFIHGTVKAGVLYLASTPTGLAALTGDTVPGYKASTVGDTVSSPVPAFFGQGINYLGLFQDRLVIGSKATLFFSRPGDYLNWSRQSVLTVNETDPVEVYALGAEDDTIRSSSPYDRNLVFCGDRNWYVINGRQKFIPQTASVTTIGAYPDAVAADPQAIGNFVFYADSSNELDGNTTTSLHQIQTGQIADSPESFEVSSALNEYLAGTPVQILPLKSPNHILLRTSGSRNVIYTYAYLDSAAGNERLFDAWSRWTWDEALGVCAGMSKHKGDVLVFTIRMGWDTDDLQAMYVACDKFVVDSKLSARPYLDSMRQLAYVETPSDDAFLNPNSDLLFSKMGVVFETEHIYGLLGTYYDQLEDFLEQYPEDHNKLWVGVEFPALVTPTNPYVLDRSNKAIVGGRLTLGRVGVSIADSSALTVDVTDANGTTRTQDFSGRLLGRAGNVVGEQPIVTTSVSAAIGREARECKYTIAAKRWLPLTVTAIEWTGQFFFNTRRV